MMNSFLVCNLYSALYEVSDVYWFMFFETCNDVVIRQLDYCYMFDELQCIFLSQVLLPTDISCKLLRLPLNFYYPCRLFISLSLERRRF